MEKPGPVPSRTGFGGAFLVFLLPLCMRRTGFQSIYLISP